MKREHWLPLSRRALDILDAARTFAELAGTDLERVHM